MLWPSNKIVGTADYNITRGNMAEQIHAPLQWHGARHIDPA